MIARPDPPPDSPSGNGSDTSPGCIDIRAIFAFLVGAPFPLRCRFRASGTLSTIIDTPGDAAMVVEWPRPDAADEGVIPPGYALVGIVLPAEDAADLAASGWASDSRRWKGKPPRGGADGADEGEVAP